MSNTPETTRDERFDDLINIIRESGRVNMSSWQSNPAGSSACVVDTLQEFHSCGNQACIGGHLALSPMFQAWGGIINPSSGEPLREFLTTPCEWHPTPLFGILGPVNITTEYLQTEHQMMTALLAGDAHVGGERIPHWIDWKAPHAIHALEITRTFQGSIEEYVDALSGVYDQVNETLCLQEETKQ